MSSRADWDRIDLLFKAALEHPADERESYLSIACPDDVRVRNEVRSLLAAHGAAGAFLETPAVRIDGDRTAASSLTLAPGDRLGTFEIVALLGAGGMGEVYRARDAQLGRDVAIKVLPPAFAAHPQRLFRFERESRVLASLNHPNIAAIHSVEHVDGLHLLVLELVAGLTLAERSSGGPLEIPDALAIARQLAAALEAAHARGIVHRDLKPSNVKLTATGQLKLLDFGLAKALESDVGTASMSVGGSQTTAGLILGTCGYMSPEQARGEPVDKRADIWAFGCILFELLTGRAAFPGNTASDTIAAVLERQPDWTSLPPGTPDDVRRLLRRCLAKDPARRLHDIADARLEIDESLDRGTESDVPPETSGPRRYVAAIAPVLLFVVAGALAAWWVRPAGPTAAAGLPLMRFAWSLPSDTRLESPPAVSPDGRMIAYAASAAGAPARLFVRALNAPEPQPVPRTEFAKQPFWSPDSRTVAYFARGTLMKVAIDGGAPVEICPAPDARGGAWSPNGTIVFSPASIFNALLRVPAAGGKPEPATLLDPGRGENSHRWPAFLPDGIHFVYFVRAIAAERRGVYIGRVDRPAATSGEPLFRSEGEAIYVTLDGGRRGALLSAGAGQIDFRPFDTRMAVTGDPISLPLAAGGNTPRQASMFSVSSNVLVHVASALPFVQRLASIDRTGAGLHIDPGRDVVSWPRVSPDDSRLVVQRLDSTTGSPDLWVEDLVRKTVIRVTEPGTSGQLPVWSPDSLRIAYVAGPPQKSVLTIAAADGTGPLVTLKCPRARCEPSDWSSDGRWLLVNGVDTTGSDIWMIPTRDDDAPRALLAGAFVERDARLSPDGTLVAYVSEETGSPEISIQTVAGIAQREVVSAGGGSQPVWSPDGAELFFVDPKGLLCRVAVTRTPAGRPVLGRAVPLDIPALGTGHFSTQYALSRAGRIYFLDRRLDDPARDVGIVVGWQGLLGGR